jgi:hypothetical protein
MVCSPSETQSYDLSQTRIDHEVENVQQTQHHQTQVSTICTMTKGTETTNITTSKTELPRNLGRTGLTA